MLKIALILAAVLLLPATLTFLPAREKVMPGAGRLILSIVWSVLVVVLGVGGTGSCSVVDTRRLDIFAAELAILPSCLVIVAIARSPIGRRRLFAAALCPFMAFFLWADARWLLILANRELDRGSPQLHRNAAMIFTSSEKGRIRYRIAVQSWVDTRPVTVGSCIDKDCPAIRDMVNVVVRPGRLGFEWIERYDFGP